MHFDRERYKLSSDRDACSVAYADLCNVKMADDSQLAEATQALSFAEFLERMKDPQAANLVKLIKT